MSSTTVNSAVCRTPTVIFSVVATGFWYLWQGGGHHFANIVNADCSFFFQILPVLIVASHVVQHLWHVYERWKIQ